MAAISVGGATGGEVEDYQQAFGPTAITLQSLELAVSSGTTPLLIVMALFAITGITLWRRRFTV